MIQMCLEFLSILIAEIACGDNENSNDNVSTICII